MRTLIIKIVAVTIFGGQALASDRDELDRELDLLYGGHTIQVNKPVVKTKVVTKTITKKIPQIQDRNVYVTFNNYGKDYVQKKYMSVQNDEALARLEEDRLKAEMERAKHPDRFY